MNSSRDSRFSGVLSGGACMRPLYDEILLDLGDFVVTPTLGSIVANWLLLIPRKRVTNFSQLVPDGVDPISLVQSVLSRLPVKSQNAIWFEHGSIESFPAIGCGVDHAHLHILIDPPFLFSEFAASFVEVRSLGWRPESAALVYGRTEPNRPYLVAGSQDEAWIATAAESAGSQFFRRIVARLVSSDDFWDYRQHAHLGNVTETLKRFRSASSCATGEAR